MIRHGWGQRGNYPLPPLKLGPDGLYLCRWCEQPVPKPRKFWCSAACVLEYRMRGDWNFLRDEIIKRDRVCRHCGGARYACRGGAFWARIGRKPTSDSRAVFLLDDWAPHLWGQFNVIEQLWEVDHIVPVVEGGTDDPQNLRLLCRPCHHRVTARWRRQKADGPQHQLLD